MSAMGSQITSLTIVYSTVYSGADQRKHQSSAPLAFVRGIHRWPMNSPHKWPITRKMLSFDDVIMISSLESLEPCNKHDINALKYPITAFKTRRICLRHVHWNTVSLSNISHLRSDWRHIVIVFKPRDVQNFLLFIKYVAKTDSQRTCLPNSLQACLLDEKIHMSSTKGTLN